MTKTKSDTRTKSAPLVAVATKQVSKIAPKVNKVRPVVVPVVAAVKPLPTTLAERYDLVKSRVEAAAKRSGRTLNDILVVAVTKHALPEQVREILSLGHRDLGENRVQHLIQQAAMVDEFQSRLRTLPSMRRAVPTGTFLDGGKSRAASGPSDTSVRWHMIGHLQRNKAKKVIDMVRLTHSVDSLRIAEELQNIALRKDRVIEVLIQVNCSGEEQKFGCPIPAAIPLAEQIGTMINVKVRGLMTMAAHSAKPEDSRATFGRCRELFEELRTSGVVEGPVNILSMGMTGDFEVAIEEGANCVRIGSAFFGEPPAGSAENDDESDED
ncbi:MAG: YggS family pyridoxal phosphate-dependent enzyme [Phycisphaerales bacterium]